MDSITQAVLGAGIQGAMLGRFQGRKALLVGAVLATLPDLDVLIRYADPVSGMIHHRGFSHSLIVLTALAALLTLLWRRWRPSPHYSAGWLFLTLWLVLATHPLLDAFTSYGTQLWWPLRPIPTSWSSIFIIDPLFTVPLLIIVLAAAIMGNRPGLWRAMRWALAWCCIYLALSVFGKLLIEHRVRQVLRQDGTQIQAMFSTPEPFNIFLWRVVARTTDDHYVETIASLFDRKPPEHLRQPFNTDLVSTFSGSPQLTGLQWFTGNWLRYDAIGNKLVVTDLRMGLGTGLYSFRFLMATRTEPGAAWQAITPQYWPRERGLDKLGAVMRRVWWQDPPLPLEKWAANMTQERPVPRPLDHITIPPGR
ncbi:metal-dependent hydrolase [Alcaligenaceae bacterium]|nr:metal-dependent hydrolase [Alcaligenaceae bacterium]